MRHSNQDCPSQPPNFLAILLLTVGNAAFHSSDLYPLLADCVEPLCSALRDTDDKTRANVAGAIGNLIRNGAQLCPLMVEQGVVELLLQLLLEDPDVGPKVRNCLFVRALRVFSHLTTLLPFLFAEDSAFLPRDDGGTLRYEVSFAVCARIRFACKSSYSLLVAWAFSTERALCKRRIPPWRRCSTR
jgi:hypothetical protein